MNLAKKRKFDVREYMQVRSYRGVEIYVHYISGLYHSQTTIDGYKKRNQLEQIIDKQQNINTSFNQLEIF